MDILTPEERIRALKCNLKNWSWDIAPQFRLEKEDADALMDYFNSTIKVKKGKYYNAVSYRIVKSIFRENK